MQELVQDPVIGMTLFNALTVWPLWRILRRAGLNPWWALAVFVPMIGLATVCGVLAHKKWPVLPERAKPVRKARRTA
ncbi:hypothetical protein [Azospirillum sp. SYSU D00513]|uniref:hypothetical protein n=1 Tax=Azospirillum sp. SYSU D00513 TaxID=2812561 RepID=UPI001A970651|nr:hypothetical protein [Azospirillum sp. SYSU D00513]